MEKYIPSSPVTSILLVSTFKYHFHPFLKSMTELSPFPVFLIVSQWRLVNKISQESLELGS